MKQQTFVKIGLVSTAVVLLAPFVASAATSTANTTINATVAPVISMGTSGTVAIAVTPTGSGAASSASDTVSVSTNNATGYKLSLADSDADTTLVSGASTIATTTGTFAAPATLTNNSWGYRVDNAGTFGAGPTAAQLSVANLAGTWALIPAAAAPQQLKSTATTAASDTTTVWYGVKTDTTKASGTYTDQVTYTAVTN